MLFLFNNELLFNIFGIIAFESNINWSYFIAMKPVIWYIYNMSVVFFSWYREPGGDYISITSLPDCLLFKTNWYNEVEGFNASICFNNKAIEQ